MNKKLLFSIFLIPLIAFSIHANGESPMPGEQYYCPRPIRLKVGQTYRIRLDESIGTGYKWSIKEPIDENSIIKLVESGYEPREKKNHDLLCFGGSQMRYWDIQALKSGTIELHFEFSYQRKAKYTIIVS